VNRAQFYFISNISTIDELDSKLSRVTLIPTSWVTATPLRGVNESGEEQVHTAFISVPVPSKCPLMLFDPGPRFTLLLPILTPYDDIHTSPG